MSILSKLIGGFNSGLGMISGGGGGGGGTSYDDSKQSTVVDETNTFTDYSQGDNRNTTTLADVEAGGDVNVMMSDYGAVQGAFEFATNAFESAEEFVSEFAESAFDDTASIFEQLAAGQARAFDKTLAIAADVTRSDADAAQRRMLQFASIVVGGGVLAFFAWRFVR